MRVNTVSISKACFACRGQNLVDVLNLGEQYVIDFLAVEDKESMRAPLRLALCTDCGLVQLKDIVPRDLMYRTYWYLSGVSPAMALALKDITQSAEAIVKLDPQDIVIDIGANDGTLLKSYSAIHIRRVGFEPAKNLAELAGDSGTIINDYFNAKAFHHEFPSERAKIITAIAMFYDLEDPQQFLREVADVLHPDGVFIVQMNYLGTMIERNTFDNICHEHLNYYSIQTFKYILEKNNLELLNVQLNDVNGGSFRAYVRHRGSNVGGNVSANVQKRLVWENENSLDKTFTYDRFAENVNKIASKLRSFISSEVEKRKRVYVLGASTRGNTILQFAGIDNKLITAAADRNPKKWGKRIVGSNIPIISKEQARRERPDYFLVLPYGFLDELRQEEHEYLRNGGRFIVPIPFPHIVTVDSSLDI